MVYWGEILITSMDFPDGPVAKTPGSQGRRQGFDPWSGNQIPHAAIKIGYVAQSVKSLPAV